jgi:hypothetical protein
MTVCHETRKRVETEGGLIKSINGTSGDTRSLS